MIFNLAIVSLTVYKKENTYTLFDGLAYNTSGYFASCILEQWAKCPLVFYSKPSNKRFIILLQKKNCYLAICFYFFGKSIQKHPDSVCENDVNNEQNVRAYNLYAKPVNERLIILLRKKTVILASIFL